MHYSKVLRNVIVSRQFTIYQLTNTILYDKPKLIVVSGLVDEFYQDPYLDPAEVESLVSQIVKSLHKIKGCTTSLNFTFGR